MLLFDLGGVIVELAGLPVWTRWSGHDEQESWSRWLHSPAVRRFESGRSGTREFAAEVVAECDLPVSAEEFQEHLNLITGAGGLGFTVAESPSTRALPTATERSGTSARATTPTTFKSALNLQEYASWPSRVICHPQEKTRRAPGGAWSSTACAVPDE